MHLQLLKKNSVAEPLCQYCYCDKLVEHFYRIGISDDIGFLTRKLGKKCCNAFGRSQLNREKLSCMQFQAIRYKESVVERDSLLFK